MEFLSSLPSLFVSLCFLEAVMSVVAFLLFGFDKIRAKTELWRVPEKTLLGASFFFGGIGALLGMRVFRHKTKHTKFRILVPLFAILQTVGITATLFL